MEVIEGKRVYDAHDAIAALREVVRGREDFVYTKSDDYSEVENRCVNWVKDGDDWRPSCIVGHVLTAWGFPNEAKGHAEADVSSRALRAQKEIDIKTPSVLYILSTAQACQDGGGTWGEALERAEKKYAWLH